MHKAAGFPVADSLCHLTGGEGGGEGHGAAGQRFAETQNIRRNPRVLAGEQLTGSTKAGGDLIGDQQDALAIAHPADPPEPLGVVHPHAARALNNRLEDHRGDFMAVGGHQTGERRHIPLIPVAVEAALRRRGEEVIRQIALPQAVH